MPSTQVSNKSKWYPAEDITAPVKSARVKRNSSRIAKLRKTITPGSVLILLSGRFRGNRVVFLKQLSSGALLVTGPYQVNGVPLRRVNQAYVIATSAKVDISGVALPEIDDSYFAREKSSNKKDEEQFFAQSSTAAVVSEQRKTDQKAVDGAILKAIGDDMKGYLSSRFTLQKGDRVHEMKF